MHSFIIFVLLLDKMDGDRNQQKKVEGFGFLFKLGKDNGKVRETCKLRFSYQMSFDDAQYNIFYFW